AVAGGSAGAAGTGGGTGSVGMGTPSASRGSGGSGSRGGECADHSRRAGAAEDGGHPPGGRGQRIQVDTGGDTESVQHPHQVLGREVSGGSGGVRAAAQATGRTVELGDAG